MGIKLGNYVSTVLAAPINAAQGTITVASIASFPAIGAADWMYLTIVDQASYVGNVQPPVKREIVKVNGPVVGTTLNVVRGQDGTAAQAFLTADVIESRLNNQSLVDLSALPQPLSGYVSVKYYGAVGDGVTDDTAAIVAAIAGISAGQVLHFPVGTYKISSQITINKSCTLQGDYNGSIIASSSGTAGDFLITSSFVQIRGLEFTPSVAQTAGWVIDIPAALRNIVVRDCIMNNFLGGIRNSSTTIDIGWVFFWNGVAGQAIVIQIDSGADVAIQHCVADAAAQMLRGVYITGCYDVTLLDLNFIHCGQAIQLNPITGVGLGVVASVIATNCSFDTSNNGLLIGASATGSTVRCRFTSCWFSSMLSRGVLLSPTGTLAGMVFDGCEMYGNALDGVLVNSNTVRDLTLVGNASAGNGGAAFSTATGASYFVLSGNRFGPAGGFGANAMGIFLGGGAGDHFNINNNYVTGNTTNYGGVSLITGTNVVVAGNDGIPTATSGTATVLSGTTSIVVTHGLAATPTLPQISITPQGTLGAAARFWISGPTATQFTINVDVNPATNVAFSWQARVLGA